MGGPLRFGVGVPSDFTPVITLTTISDQDDLSAMTVSLNTVTIGGVTKTPSAVAFRVNSATTGLADPTAVGGTTFTPTRGGEYTIGGTVTIDGVTYAITPQTRTVGVLDNGLYWVTVYDDTFNDAGPVDFTSQASGTTWTRTGRGGAGGDIDVVVSYNAAVTVLETSAGGLTLVGPNGLTFLYTLTDMYASWNPKTPTRAQVLTSSANFGTDGDRVEVLFSDVGGTEREGLAKYRRSGTSEWDVRSLVASVQSDDPVSTFAGATHHGVERCGECFTALYDNSTSAMPDTPTRREQWSRAKTASGTSDWASTDTLRIVGVDGGGGGFTIPRFRVQMVLS